LDRRKFVGRAGTGALALLAGATGCVRLNPRADRDLDRRGARIAFNTANLVARVTGYRYELSHWGEQHRKTVAATDERAWRGICEEIAAAGFKSVEIWEAHASPEALTPERLRAWKRVLSDTGLQPVAYAGGLRRETLGICAALGILHIDGGLSNLRPDEATVLCREFGIAFNLENHPEKSAEEIRAKVAGGNEWLGICVDTGWLGTQAANAPQTILTLGPLVRHTHIKDIRAAGRHETCLLGDGVVNLPGCFQALRTIGYTGCFSWEDEPEDRNPFDSAVRNRQWIERHLAG
jgi:sugar phosphate isomerase/epimerase